MKIYGAFASALKNGKYHAIAFTFNAEDDLEAKLFAQSYCVETIYPKMNGWSQHNSGVAVVTREQLNVIK